ncbi:hypothetical protein RSSM_03351 [Rhodopirellula sallentina SM41]|uniref:Uncharacterized protein n=1 Tax=Rhodopirellula sallentina SM41 TaxID=1263870 RepID=M5U1S8_9BACT|nr:hypothetical protein RSSM_03351 [Rhodopirellula sallentina SM41]
MTEDVIRIAADAVSDLLFDADDEMAYKLFASFIVSAKVATVFA